MTARGFQHDHIGVPSAADLDEADLARCGRCHCIVDAGNAKDAGDATLCPDCYRDRMVADVVAGVRCVCCWELKANCGYARVDGRRDDDRSELPAGTEFEASVRYPEGGIGRHSPTSRTTDYDRGEGP